MDQRGADAIAPEPEMRLRLRADLSSVEETADGLTDPELDARLWSESGAVVFGAVLGTIGLAAWGALAPWHVTADAWAEVTWVEVTVRPFAEVVGIAVWLVGSAIGYGAWALVVERRRPWPFGLAQARVRVRLDWVILVLAILAAAGASVAVADGDWAWIDAAATEIDAGGSPPAIARRVIAQVDVGLVVVIASRALLVAAMRRARPGMRPGWLQGAAAR